MIAVTLHVAQLAFVVQSNIQQNYKHGKKAYSSHAPRLCHPFPGNDWQSGKSGPTSSSKRTNNSILLDHFVNCLFDSVGTVTSKGSANESNIFMY